MNNEGRTNSSNLLLSCQGEGQRERYTLATQQQLLHLCTLFHLPVIEYALYLPIAVDSSPGPQPPTGVSVDILSHESVVAIVSWDA